METTESVLPKHNRSKVYIAISFAFVFLAMYLLLGAPLSSNPTTIHVVKKATLKNISSDLKNKNVIRSQGIFEIAVKVLGSGKSIQTGDYFFDKNLSVLRVAYMLATGDHNTNPIRITLREGLTNTQMADIFASNLPNFNKEEFNRKTEGKQGKLFPDTYFIFPLSTTDEIIEMLENNFNKSFKKFEIDISKSKKDYNDIIVMASIIEKESNGEKDAQIISGILWKRISLKMPLQVDVSPITYKVAGLPSEPICNPGQTAIHASIKPVDSPYLYYLHDKSGMIHLASTFTEHKRNIALYLK